MKMTKDEFIGSVLDLLERAMGIPLDSIENQGADQLVEAIGSLYGNLMAEVKLHLEKQQQKPGDHIKEETR